MNIVEDLLARLKALEEEVVKLKAREPKRRVRNPKRCKMDTEKGVKFWLPGCMGGAVYGDIDHCTCDRYIEV